MLNISHMVNLQQMVESKIFRDINLFSVAKHWVDAEHLESVKKMADLTDLVI